MRPIENYIRSLDTMRQPEIRERMESLRQRCEAGEYPARVEYDILDAELAHRRGSCR